MKSKFVSLYHLYSLYDAVKQIKFSFGHLESDLEADDLMVQKKFDPLICALGRIDVSYLEGLIEDEISRIIGLPPSQDQIALVVQFQTWCRHQKLRGSAEEIRARKDLTLEQRTWIESYIKCWNKTSADAQVEDSSALST